MVLAKKTLFIYFIILLFPNAHFHSHTCIVSTFSLSLSVADKQLCLSPSFSMPLHLSPFSPLSAMINGLEIGVRRGHAVGL